MSVLSNPLLLVTVVMATVFFTAGFKSCAFHGGPGPFELIAMLWRGEIKGRK